mgnify:CR=1 FL=1
MADRRIESLPEANGIYAADLFLVSQSKQAKKVSKQTLIRDLTSEAMVKGGIKSIELANRSGLVDTYTITYGDLSTQNYTVTNGEKGNPGANAYLHVVYADNQPLSDADIKYDTGDWLGLASTNSPTRPSHYTDYTWQYVKGLQGDPGINSEVVSRDIQYAVSEDGSSAPESGWGSSPHAEDGKYLWTRTSISFNTGEPVVFYSVSKVGRNGADGGGAGTVTSVAVENAQNGGLNVSGSPVTNNGTIIIGHSNSVTAKNTFGIYPFKYDSNGHITGTGEAVNPIPNPASKQSGQVLTWDGSAWVGRTPASSVTKVANKSADANGNVALSAADIGAIPAPALEQDKYLKCNGTGWELAEVQGGGSGFEITWLKTNGSPNSGFAAGSIEVSGADWKAFVVTFKALGSSGGAAAYIPFIVPIDHFEKFQCGTFGWGNQTIYKRQIESITVDSDANKTYIKFSGGYKDANTPQDTAMIPYSIWGLK